MLEVGDYASYTVTVAMGINQWRRALQNHQQNLKSLWIQSKSNSTELVRHLLGGKVPYKDCH